VRAGLPSVQIRKLLGRAARVAATLGGPPEERAKLVRQLVEKIIVDEKRLTIKVRRSAWLGGDVLSSASEGASDSAVELTAAAAFTRRGAETKLVLPGLAQQNRSSRCDPAMIKAIARGRAQMEMWHLLNGGLSGAAPWPLWLQRHDAPLTRLHYVHMSGIGKDYRVPPGIGQYDAF
jgi:hypothetical protein